VLDLTSEPASPDPPAPAPAYQTIPFTACAACAELPYSAIDYVHITGVLFAVPARRWTFTAFASVPLCRAHAPRELRP
jgi:hypothetical protein